VIDLDDVSALEKLDSEDVLGAVERFAEQCREAWAIGSAAPGLPQAADLASVLVLGMGGSGVSGDVLGVVAEQRLGLPVSVLKSYGPLPAWVGPNTLVFAVSYSGSTEETLAALTEAFARGAHCVIVASGGPLADMAADRGAPLIQIPSGLQPRASLGYLALPILAAMQSMGLLPGVDADVRETIEVVEELAARCHRSVPRAQNPAKRLASFLEGRVAVVYGGHGAPATAAMRFKCDLNEYGKVPAFWNALPEMDHNEIVGWSGLTELTSNNMALVLLRDPEEHERVSMRFEITRDLIGSAAADVMELKATGRSVLARLFSLVFVTQLAAIYVGLARGVDPGPVDVIQRLKAELNAR
jgi:glucose/mannose-6-phosphate isomerase